MSEQKLTLTTRIKHKTDTTDKWNVSDLVIGRGEMITYADVDSEGNPLPVRFKIGDGTKTANELEFANFIEWGEF